MTLELGLEIGQDFIRERAGAVKEDKTMQTHCTAMFGMCSERRKWPLCAEIQHACRGGCLGKVFSPRRAVQPDPTMPRMLSREEGEEELYQFAEQRAGHPPVAG